MIRGQTQLLHGACWQGMLFPEKCNYLELGHPKQETKNAGICVNLQRTHWLEKTVKKSPKVTFFPILLVGKIPRASVAPSGQS